LGIHKPRIARLQHHYLMFIVSNLSFSKNTYGKRNIQFRRGDTGIAKKISNIPEFSEKGYYSCEESLEDIEKETGEIRYGLPSRWYSPKEIQELLEKYGFREIVIKGNGLLMKLLKESDREMAEFMKKQPMLLFEIEKRLIPFTDPEKAPTIIVKRIKK
jgi:hypothetical protein